MFFLIPDGTCSIFWKILILENYRIFEFFNFGKLGYYYYSKKGRYNPVVGGGVVVLTLGFCAGLPAGDKSLIIFPPASRPAGNHQGRWGSRPPNPPLCTGLSAGDRINH